MVISTLKAASLLEKEHVKLDQSRTQANICSQVKWSYSFVHT